MSAWKQQSVVTSYLTGVRAAIPLAAEQLDLLARVIAHNEHPVSRFLDIGAGDGILSQLLLDRYPKSVAVAADFSEPMLRAAANRLAPYGDRVTFARADMSRPSWNHGMAGPFDAIVSGFAIHHLAHARKYELYSEIFALLAGGGLFLNLEHVASEGPWGESLFDEAIIESLIGYEAKLEHPRSNQDVRRAYLERPDKADNILLRAEVQCQWLRLIGFDRVDVYFKWLELALFGGVKPKV